VKQFFHPIFFFGFFPWRAITCLRTFNTLNAPLKGLLPFKSGS